RAIGRELLARVELALYPGDLLVVVRVVDLAAQREREAEVRVVVVRAHLEGFPVGTLRLCEAAERQIDRGVVHLRFEELRIQLGSVREGSNRTVDLTELVLDEA